MTFMFTNDESTFIVYNSDGDKGNNKITEHRAIF